MSEKIIVIDDDPTGSQTVHSCLLLTRWDEATLALGLADASPLLFILSNTRALPATEAAAVTRAICRQLNRVLRGYPHPIFIVSRSDSTLRGHYPVETDVIAEELGPFDAHFLIPAFFEGGRFTLNSTHYVMVDGQAVPVNQTEFAQDSVFGYQHAYLPAYIEEKTHGRIPAAQVQRFTLTDLHQGCLERLLALHANACCVVDAQTQPDLDAFAGALRQAVRLGKRFFFRSAASLLTALAQLPPPPVPPSAMARYVRGGQPGVIVVGSHVSKTTEQLKALLGEPGMIAVEVDVSRLPAEHATLLSAVLAKVTETHAAGKTPVLFTSRQERVFATSLERLQFGQAVMALLIDCVRALPSDIGFLLCKGGITANEVLRLGLDLAASRLLGQILPGVSVTVAPPDHPTFPGLPVIIFPGNVGDQQALVTVYQRLTGPPQFER